MDKPDMRRVADYYADRGLQLVALDGKRPVKEGWQDRAEPPKHWTEHPDHGIGCNHKLSGTCTLDIDHPEYAAIAFERMGLDLEAVLSAGIQSQGAVGRHKTWFRRSAELGVHKIVWPHPTEKDADGRPKQVTILELRGAGGQDVLPPSRHPDGHRYTWVDKSQAAAPVADWPEVPDDLKRLWVDFDRQAWLSACPWRESPRARRKLSKSRREARDADVIGAFNEDHDVGQLLEAHGYTRHANGKYLSPNSTTGMAGVWVSDDGKRCWSHHGDALGDGESHDAFDVFRILSHDGDWSAAVKDAAHRLGIGRKRKSNGSKASGPEGVSVEDFYAYLPDHRYLHVPTQALWPATSVNAKCGGDINGMSASQWLDENRSIEQMLWHPDKPQLVEDMYADKGGWIAKPGARAFNTYRPPELLPGDPSKAGPWLDHVHRIYPDDADHLVRYFAFKVQHPGVKINHALVLGGGQGIGKDTILVPVKQAIGTWNCSDISPGAVLANFNPWIKCVLAVISEGRDLGEFDRFSFYEKLKIYTAAPPDVLEVNEKYLRQQAAFNVMGVVVTTNHRTGGIHLPPDDRRHYVAWSTATKEQFSEAYWRDLYGWYEDGGIGHVAAYLRELDLGDFNPKAPPKQTDAWYTMTAADTPKEEIELLDVIEGLGEPAVLTLDLLKQAARSSHYDELASLLEDKKSLRAVPHKLDRAGYVQVRNRDAKDGYWKIDGRRVSVYGSAKLTLAQQMEALKKLPKLVPVGEVGGSENANERDLVGVVGEVGGSPLSPLPDSIPNLPASIPNPPNPQKSDKLERKNGENGRPPTSPTSPTKPWLHPPKESPTKSGGDDQDRAEYF